MQATVRIARRYGVALYPISTGHNWDGGRKLGVVPWFAQSLEVKQGPVEALRTGVTADHDVA